MLPVLLGVALLGGGCDPLLDEPIDLDAVQSPGPGATRDDVDCTRRGLGEDGEIRYLTARLVVEGQLGAVCLGEDDPALQQLWDTLATMAPAPLREELAALALFEPTEPGEDVTLAFVAILDDEGEMFQMAFNADEVAAGGDELLLTIAHEFSHVFTATTDQIDRVVAPQDCETYDNGEGCYLADSIMLGWIEAFWSDDQLAGVDQSSEPLVADGEDRCARDPGFFGPYGATTPEEDFGESFSAFVLGVDPLTEAQAERLVWFEEHTVLREVRDRARAAGLGPLEHSFEECGLG